MFGGDDSATTLSTKPPGERSKMRQTTENSRKGYSQDRVGGPETAAMNRAVRAAFQVYQYRELEHNLKTFGWRGARRRVLGNGTLSGEWVRRAGCEVRLTRRGLEVHLPGEEIRLLSWQELWEFSRERRS
jgi:hypothetical protein